MLSRAGSGDGEASWAALLERGCAKTWNLTGFRTNARKCNLVWILWAAVSEATVKP